MTKSDAGFDALLNRIEAASLRDIAGHWAESCNGRRMPAWRDIDPIKIAPHLPIVWSWRYDRDSDRFTGRLIGQAIVELFGKSIRGVRMEDYFSGDAYEAVYTRCRRVVTTPCFSRDCGMIYNYVDQKGRGERILMPLADDGENADGLIGATFYDVTQHAGHDVVQYATAELEYYPL